MRFQSVSLACAPCSAPSSHKQRKEYNEERPHSSLGYRTPREFAAALAAAFNTAERGVRNSNAVPCPSRTPIPAQTGEGTRTELSYSYVNESRGQVKPCPSVMNLFKKVLGGAVSFASLGVIRL
jgi:hypothetical protein